MDDRTKCELYTKLLNSLGDFGELKEEISESTFSNHIKLIKIDLVSKVHSDQETALQILQILIDNNVHSIHNEVFDILNNINMDQMLKDRILEALANHLKDLIQTSNITELSLLYSIWRSYNVRKFLDVLQEVCDDNECSLNSKNILLNVLMPLMLDKNNTNDASKVICIDLALEFASVRSVTNLSAEDYNTILLGVNDYINHMLELRESNCNYWHKLWIFLVRLLGKKLHNSMHLMNKLLRVVEHAFRNSSFEQRVRGYECWKELIDNVSLDPQHISSDKQIKLLLTPLRAKFSRQEAVIIKRFEVFVHLIEKLQAKAVLVLKEFLEFSFGDVGANTEPQKTGQGKSLPELWLRSATVLLAVLGHSHDENETCLEPGTEINLEVPVVNSRNISDAYCHVINSVAECCKLLKGVELGQHRYTILSCLWGSLLHIVLSDDVEQKTNCIKCIGKVLDSMLKENDPYYHSIATIIFKETIKIEEHRSRHLFLANLDRFLNIIFSVPLSEECYIDVGRFLAIIRNSESIEESAQVVTQVFDCFTRYKTVETNADFVAEFWIFLANELEDYARGHALSYLVWPVLHAHQLKEPVKQVSVYEHYQRLLLPFVQRSDELHLALFKYFDKALKNNPLLLKNVLTLITMFEPKTNHKEITNVTLDNLAFMLLVPSTSESTNQRQSIEEYLTKLYQSDITKIHDQDTIKRLCACVEHLLKLKHYDILAPVEESLRDCPDNIKWIHGKFLTLDFLGDIFEKETDLKVTEKIHRIIQLLRNLKNPEPTKDITGIMPLGGRSAKIAKLVKQIPPSPNKVTTSPSTLRLFGKDVETHSPLKVLENRMKSIKSTPKKGQTYTPQKKKQTSPFIDDESNSKFVLIESEVKLDKAKLTEHQKESLKKRREDIPALYQDLSQSASQSFDSNSCPTTKPNNEPEEVFKKPIEFDLNIIKSVHETDEEKTTETIKEDILKTEESEDINQESSMKAENKSKGANRKAKIEVELKKLSMDIVGAQDFVAAGSKRKRRDTKLQKKWEPVEKRKRLSVTLKVVEPSAIKNDDSSSVTPSKGNTKKGRPKHVEACAEESDNLKKITSEPSSSPNLEHNEFENELVKGEETDTERSDIKDSTKEEVSDVKATENIAEDATLETEIYNFKSFAIKNQVGVSSESGEPPVFAGGESQQEDDDIESTTSTGEVEVDTKSVIEEKQARKARKSRKSLTVPKTTEEVRKSRRKSLPTEKFTQSDFFKNMKLKKLPSDSFKGGAVVTKEAQDTREINIVLEKQSGLSTLFAMEPNENQSGEARIVESGELVSANVENKPRSASIGEIETAKITDEGKNDKNHQSVNGEAQKSSKSTRNSLEKPAKKPIAIEDRENKIYNQIKNKKRRRLSSSEGDDDDIIESSQESSVSNIHASKLRLFASKRSSLIEKTMKAPNVIPTVTAKSNKEVVTRKRSKTPKQLVKANTIIDDVVSAQTGKAFKDRHFSEGNSSSTSESSIPKRRGRPSKNNGARAQSDNDEARVEATPEGDKSKKRKRRRSPRATDDKCQKNEESQSLNTIEASMTNNLVEDNDAKQLPANIKEADTPHEPKKRGRSKRKRDDSVGSDRSADLTSIDLTIQRVIDNYKELDAHIPKKRGRSKPNLENSFESDKNADISEDLATRHPLESTKGDNAHVVKKRRKHKDKNADISGDWTVQPVEHSLQESTKSDSPRRIKHEDLIKSDKNADISGDWTTQTVEPNLQELPKTCRHESPQKLQKGVVEQAALPEKQADICPEKVLKDTQDTVIAATQSQETQTQGSESMAIDSSEVQLQLDLPQKSALTESEQEIARMDTASLPLVDDLDMSTSSEQLDTTNKTVVENKTLTVTIPSLDNSVGHSNGVSEDIFGDPSEVMGDSSEAAKEVLGDPSEATKDVLSDPPEVTENVFGDSGEVAEEVLGDPSDVSAKVLSGPSEVAAHVTSDPNEVTDTSDITTEVLSDPSEVAGEVLDDANEVTQEVVGDTNDVMAKSEPSEVVGEVLGDTNEITEEVVGDTTAVTTEVLSEPSEVAAEVLGGPTEVTEEVVGDQTKVPPEEVLCEVIEVAFGDPNEVADQTRVTEVLSDTIIGVTEQVLDDQGPKPAKVEKSAPSYVEQLEEFLGFSEQNVVIPDSTLIDEIAATEELVRQLADRDIEVTVEPDRSSPIRNQASGNCVGTPRSFESSIPSSPVTGDTPNRTSELLDNTSDISPIGSKSGSEKSSSSSDDEFVEERKLMPVALKFDQEDAELGAHKQNSPEKADDAPQKMDERSPEKAEKEVEIIALDSPPPKDGVKIGRIEIEIESSASPLLGMFKRYTCSPLRRKGHKMSRIKKLMSNVKPSSQAELIDDLSQEDILTFTREVPSPLAVPRSGILKRKHSDTNDDGISPCAKRKRVNFSDPCTTSKKVFLKEDVADPLQCLLSNSSSSDDLDKQFMEVLAANNLPTTPQTESDIIETEPSLQVNNPMLLRNDIPIYPELIDCEESVSVISRKLTGPMFVNALLSKLNGSNIKTIGDLAKQSEVNITRLPFKTPMLATVYKALDYYYHKNFKCKGSGDKVVQIVAVNGEREPRQDANLEELPPAEVTVETVDVKLELSRLLDRARCENVPIETLCSLVFGSSDQKQVVAWIRTHFNLQPRDMVEEKDIPTLIKYITESQGLPKIFEILTESLESSEDESVYFDCMIKHSIEKRSLGSLIERRSLDELNTAIWENIENGKYSKNELLEVCFLPYVYSIDLAPFFNRLTVVEIGDIVLNRLRTEDYKTFMTRITERCSNRDDVRDKILQNYSIAELANNIIKRGTTKEIVSSFTYMFLTAGKEDKEDLVQIFKLVSDCLLDELPPSRLMELSVDFLKRIPIRD